MKFSSAASTSRDRLAPAYFLHCGGLSSFIRPEPTVGSHYLERGLNCTIRSVEEASVLGYPAFGVYGGVLGIDRWVNSFDA